MQIIEKLRHEPVALMAFTQAILAGLVGFEVVAWSPEQIGIVEGGVSAAFLVVRWLVTPVSK